MSESRRTPEPWKPDDDITALRLQTMQDLAESAQLTAIGPNVRLYKGVQGGTAIAVDETPSFPGQIFRMKVTTVDPNSDTTLVLAKFYDGTAVSGSDIPVRKAFAHIVDDEFYAFTPKGGVIGNPTYDPPGSDPSGPVVWQEIFRLPNGTGKYKVLQFIDALDPGTPGWDYVRFH